MTRSYSLILLSTLLLLSACAGTAPPPAPVTLTHTVIVLPSDNLIGGCIITPPPAKSVFRKATRDEQVNLLANNGGANIINLGNCNKKWASLRDWKSAIKQKYQSDPDVTIQE